MNDIYFADCDSQNIEAALLSAYETIAKTTLYPADPVRLFLEAIAYQLTIQNNLINLAGRQNLLAYATGNHLDYIGMMVGCARLSASKAQCEQAFFLKDALAFPVIIPAGSRVTTADGAAIFVLTETLAIQPGEIAISGIVEAEKAGANQNGLLPGQINLLIDPVAYIARTANLTASLSGSDLESDAHYRERIRQAPESFSCAGPAGAYRYYVLASHQDISDVAVYSPMPGVVDVRPVLKGGELPTSEILSAISEKLNAEDIRPLTDTVTVQAPELVEYEISFTWYLEKGNSIFLNTIADKIREAVEIYRIWQREKPGRDILPLKLQSLLEQAGARRVELFAPVFRPLAQYELARETGINIIYGGIEE